MGVAVGNGLTAEPWTRPADAGAHARRAAGFVVWSQVEAGPPLPGVDDVRRGAGPRGRADVAARWMPGLASRTYDPVLRRWRTRPG